MSAPPALSVLLVEDYAIDALYLIEILDGVEPAQRPHVEHVGSIADAEQTLAERTFDCVLLDLALPDGHGVENVQRIRAASRTATIVVMTGLDDERRAIEALELGAQDYLVKGRLDSADLMRHLRRAIQRHRLVTDLDREHELQKRLAGRDALTGLANRQLLGERARDEMAHARRRGDRLAFCFIDLDGFKAINDALGHAAGDVALIAVADALLEAVRAEDTVARIGGDEFVVMQVAVRDESDVRETGRRLVEAVRGIRSLNGQPIRLGASVGAAIFPDHGDSFESLLLHADGQMYRAKRAGGSDVRVQSASRVRIPSRLETAEASIDDAGLVYQPWVGGRGGVEALLRLRRDGRWTGADELLRIADRPGPRSTLSQWVLQTACGQWASWHRAVHDDLGRLAVNMTAAEVARSGFPEIVTAVLASQGLPRDTLQIEIAEPLLDAPERALLDNMASLRAAGVRLVIDQFGRQRASLRALTRLPIDGVKLDASVVRGLESADNEARALVAGIVAAAQIRQLEVAAVGVECEAQARACIALSCEALQGLWYAGWVGPEELPRLLAGRDQQVRRSWLREATRRCATA
ncbi:MAG: response regulator [Panacagrimonas sp.]|nr:GGDEF domain-containing response regulator [Panacagrimonas sp.]MCC2657215.1 response regulator [Panacagrimonas sp.]